MCTDLILETNTGEILFGRNLDWVYNLGQSELVVPRTFDWYNSVNQDWFSSKYAVLGIGDV